MSKAKISNRTYIIQITLWLLSMSGFFVHESFANLISLDGLLQNISQIWSKTTIESSSSNIWQKDIFLTTLQNQQAWSSKALLQSIDNTLNSITQKAQKNGIISCSIKKSDIITILNQQPWFIDALSQQWNIPLWTSIQNIGDITQSCERFLHCDNKLSNSQRITQNKQLSDCISVVYNTYITNNFFKESSLSLPYKNNNDNIYMDGIRDNALFDLMIDITNIKNILFEKNSWPSTPTMIYYSLPTVNTPNNSNISNWIPWAIWAFWWQNNVWSIEWNTILNSIGNTTPSSITNSTINNTNTWNNTNSVINSFINDVKPNNTNEDEVNLPTATIQSALCPIPWSELIDNTDNNNSSNSNETESQFIEELYTLQDELLEIMNWSLYLEDTTWSTSWNLWLNNNWNWSSNIIQTNNAIPWTTQACQNSCANITNQTEKLICEGKCCISSCNQINNTSDKAVCISQCLCGEVSTANDMLRIKICRVPAQPARVLAWKKISSIEEAVTEINEIFNKLKQNGLLSKRSKTQEFMDSSFSNIKFHEVFAFDIFVAIKPIYDKIQVRQQQENIKKDHNNLKNTDIFIWWKLWKWADKNKYLIVWDTKSWDDWIKYCTSLWQTFNPLERRCIINNIAAETINKLSKVNTSFKINDGLYQFTKEKYTIREQLYKQFSDIQTTADILKTKAENAQ